MTNEFEGQEVRTPAPPTPEASDGKGDDGLGSLAQSARKSQLGSVLGSVRGILFLIGTITLVWNVSGAVFARQVVEAEVERELRSLGDDAEAASIDAEELQRFKEGAIAKAVLTNVGFGLVGALFLVLGALIYRRPIICTVLALVSYLAATAITVMADPTMITKGWMMKAFIMYWLVNGIRVAIAHEREVAAP